MIHIIPLIVGYVGGDLSTSFARKHVEKMKGKLAQNPDGPICLLLEREEMYRNYSQSSYLFKNGYFTTELLRRMTFRMPGFSWIGLFSSPHIPLEFIEESKRGRGEFWNCPLIPLVELKKRAEATKSDAICGYILCNPALFSEGIGRAEDVINIISLKAILSEERMRACLSSNIEAPVGFFLRNPRYMSWDNLASNEGKVFRGEDDEEKERVIRFLNRWFKSCSDVYKLKLVQNRAVPLKFLEEIIEEFNRPMLTVLSSNPSITLSWWYENVGKIGTGGSRLYDFASKPSTPYSLILESLLGCETKSMNHIIIKSYNAPPDKIIEICEEDPDVDWSVVALNQGFWIHLAEMELTPILQSFFNVCPLPMKK